MRVSQLKNDTEGLWFKIESDDTKNSEPTRIYLNDMAAQIVDDILNHKQHGITRRVYDLYSRSPEIKRALTSWGEAVQRAIDGTQAEVVSINQQH